ncbi:MAG: hypothetical protein K2F57_02505 [Candidatus Gastranaerophilales bacterium]|nr:hypothetical protein [Candidatus Gastranaerophilales bacterium]
MNVTFSGIYDINFPAGTKPAEINSKYQQAKILYEKYYGYNKNMPALGVHILKESTGKNPPIIRMNTPYDNPILMVELFKVIDVNLARQYIAKTKVDLYV